MLKRTAIRIATINALSNMMKSPFPTMAINKVYDSRDQVYRHVIEDDQFAVISVFTANEQGEVLDQINKEAFPSKKTLELIIEFAVASVWPDSGNATHASIASETERHIQIIKDEHDLAFGEISQNLTDREIEFALDLLEEQIRSALFDYSGSNARLWRALFKHINSSQCNRYTDSEGEKRFRARQLVLQVTYDECSPIPKSSYALLSRIGISIDHIDPAFDPNLADRETECTDGRIEQEMRIDL